MDTEVVIIGAGPTGLMAANHLNRFGIDFVIIDNKAAPTNESRAISVSARSMELYQQLDLSDAVIEQSTFVNDFAFYNQGKKLAGFSFTNVGVGYSDFYKPINAFEQSKNETVLHENLKSYGKSVLWNTQFISVSENNNGVEVVIKNIQSNENQIITAKYIIGCDGARSLVRHQGNFSFEGGTYETKFYVADTKMDWKYGYDKIIMSPSNGIFVAFFPLKGDKKVRVIGTLPVEFTDKEDIDFEILEKIIRKSSKFELNFESVGWHSVYKIHHRCVDSFNKGRIFLAGDAAHIHSPAGGQGMNTGLQDAHNLSWKMAMVLKGIAKPSLLDTYNEERLPFAKSLLKFTDKGFKMLTSGNWWIQNFRNLIMLPALGFFMKFQSFRTIQFKVLSQLFYSYKKCSLAKSNSNQKLKFKAGDQLPFIETGYFTNFKEPIFHLICVSDSGLNIDNQNIKNNFPFDIKIINNKIEAWKKFGVQSNLFILVRPDHHILYISDQLNKEEINNHLEQFFNIKF